MKIGIITFHWAINYGAILQAFALQMYLKKMGHDAYIINYRPKQYKKTILNCFFTIRFWLYLKNINDYFKDKKLEKFRAKYLNETLLYESLDELISNSPKYDVYICGSDQIWNPYFTTLGEGKPTTSYFLDFGDKDVKRIAYAVSFGCENYPESAYEIAKKYINNFDAISVRENSGIPIVLKMGYKSPIKLPDPTLLLLSEDYYFSNTEKVSSRKKAFVYLLRGENKEVKNIVSYLKTKHKIESTNDFLKYKSVEEWVSCIRNASIVLTNSFHGMVFSLIFHVPFIVFPAKGISSGMNDRFITLLTYLNLEHRILKNIEKIDNLVVEQIDWLQIDKQIEKLRIESNEFFDNVLG